jgi:hypothetical protein
MPEPIFMKLGMYIMAPEPIPKGHFINPSHQSVCLYVYPPIVTRQPLGKNVKAPTYATYVGRVVSKQSRRSVIHRTSCLFSFNLSAHMSALYMSVDADTRILTLYHFKAQWLLYEPPSLTYQNSTFCPHSVYVCSIRFSQ